MRRGARGGFTIVELLVVITVIGVLAGIILAAVQSVNKTARKAACTQLLKEVATALQAYQADEGRFPPDRYVNWTAADAGPLGIADAAADRSFVWMLMHGKTVYLNMKDDKLVDSSPGDGSIDRTDLKLQIKDPWWVSDSPMTNVLLYIAAPHRQKNTNYMSFKGGGPGMYNLWSPGPDGKCDSCQPVTGFSGDHPPGGNSAPPSTADSVPHLGGSTQGDDVK